jgi:hypothetical protein
MRISARRNFDANTEKPALAMEIYILVDHLRACIKISKRSAARGSA